MARRHAVIDAEASRLDQPSLSKAPEVSAIRASKLVAQDEWPAPGSERLSAQAVAGWHYHPVGTGDA